MILNAVSELYNYTSFNNLANVNIDSNFLNYTNKPDFSCEFINAGTDEIKFIFTEKLNLTNIALYWKGTFDNLKIQISLDNITWRTIFDGEYFDEDNEYNYSFIFIKFIFTNHIENFKIISLSLNVNLTYNLDAFVSHNSMFLVPSKIRENNTNTEDFINTFLRMLERNTPMAQAPCNFDMVNIGVYYDEVDYTSGGINSQAIDDFAVDEE
jgi:hypothetical protein